MDTPTLSPQEREAQILIVDQIESAFNLVLEHIIQQSLATGGMVSTEYIQYTHSTIIKGMKKGIDSKSADTKQQSNDNP